MGLEAIGPEYGTAFHMDGLTLFCSISFIPSFSSPSSNFKGSFLLFFPLFLVFIHSGLVNWLLTVILDFTLKCSCRLCTCLSAHSVLFFMHTNWPLCTPGLFHNQATIAAHRASSVFWFSSAAVRWAVRLACVWYHCLLPRDQRKEGGTRLTVFHPSWGTEREDWRGEGGWI